MEIFIAVIAVLTFFAFIMIAVHLSTHAQLKKLNTFKATVVDNYITTDLGYIIEVKGGNTHCFYRENGEIKVFKSKSNIKDDLNEYYSALEIAIKINKGEITNFNPIK